MKEEYNIIQSLLLLNDIGFTESEIESATNIDGCVLPLYLEEMESLGFIYNENGYYFSNI